MVLGDARIRGGAMSWEPLPDRDWAPTIRSLHRWSQIVGKVRMALAAPMNHWWHVTSYVSTRGLTTSPIPYRGGLFELEFDLHADLLRLRTSDGRDLSIRLEPVSVADFFPHFRDLLRNGKIVARIGPAPVKVEDQIPFALDTPPGGNA